MEKNFSGCARERWRRHFDRFSRGEGGKKKKKKLEGTGGRTPFTTFDATGFFARVLVLLRRRGSMCVCVCVRVFGRIGG